MKGVTETMVKEIQKMVEEFTQKSNEAFINGNLSQACDYADYVNRLIKIIPQYS